MSRGQWKVYRRTFCKGNIYYEYQTYKNHSILPTRFICALYGAINSECFPQQHYTVGLSSAEKLFRVE